MVMNVDEYALMTMMMMNSIRVRIRRMGMTKMYCCDSGYTYRVTWGGQEERGSHQG